MLLLSHSDPHLPGRSTHPPVATFGSHLYLSLEDSAYLMGPDFSRDTSPSSLGLTWVLLQLDLKRKSVLSQVRKWIIFWEDSYVWLLPAHHQMHVLSGSTLPLPCSSAHIIKNHSSAFHVSLSIQSLAPSLKLSSVTDPFLMPDDLKAGWKISRMFSHSISICL